MKLQIIVILSCLFVCHEVTAVKNKVSNMISWNRKKSSESKIFNKKCEHIYCALKNNRQFYYFIKIFVILLSEIRIFLWCISVSTVELDSTSLRKFNICGDNQFFGVVQNILSVLRVFFFYFFFGYSWLSFDVRVSSYLSDFLNSINSNRKSQITRKICQKSRNLTWPNLIAKYTLSIAFNLCLIHWNESR